MRFEEFKAMCEKVILRNLDPKYNWLVRDDNVMHHLYVFENRPRKHQTFGWTAVSGGIMNMAAFNHLFKCIRTDEPCEFKKWL